MNLLYIALLYRFIFWTTVDANDDKRPHPSDKVTFHLNINAPNELSVTLQRTDTFLANENLQVWSVSADQPNQLRPIKNVMQKIGRYEAFQSRDDSSAAVYFYKQHKFTGMIDSRYYIHDFLIENLNDVIYVYRRNSVVSVRHTRYHHRRSSSIENQEEKFLNTTKSSTRVFREIPEVVFVKILLIVGPDVVAALRDEPDNVDTSVTSYLLSLLNSVDMLYSKINQLKIRMNIAGIIIGTDDASFPFLTSCYKVGRAEDTVQTYLEAACASEHMTSWTKKYLKEIPKDSYDIVTYLTSFPLRYDRDNVEVVGTTSNVMKGPYQLRKVQGEKFPCIIFKDTADFATAGVLAHEIAHALRYKAHYDGPVVDENGKCCSFIMARRSTFCQYCLDWNSATINHLKQFFSSRDRCSFIKDPLSLKTPKPKKIWSADEQCQCYRYDKSGIAKRTLVDKICRLRRGGMCQLNLKCLDDRGKTHKAPLPMDGTPCENTADNKERVCWNNACVPVEN